MIVLQLPLLSHSCCSLNAASARAGLGTCFALEHIAFVVLLHLCTAQSKDYLHMIHLLLPNIPLPFLLLSLFLLIPAVHLLKRYAFSKVTKIFHVSPPFPFFWPPLESHLFLPAPTLQIPPAAHTSVKPFQ